MTSFVQSGRLGADSARILNSFLFCVPVNYVLEESTIEDGSIMKLWSVNGRFIGHVTCEHMINCLEFSSAPEGISVNVIATGLTNGVIR